MDGNKDEAQKCLKIGKQALNSGDRARSLKFFSKAAHLDPSLSPTIDQLLNNNNNSTPPDPPPTTSDSSTLRSRSNKNPKTNATNSPTNTNSNYSEEQLNIVLQIKKEKDLYKILGLDRTCSVDDIRKAYRKISLKVHPDKNNAPGAEDAFKAVSRAFQCLSDEGSRRRYDVSGSEEPAGSRGGAARHGNHGGFEGFYEGDFDADEIFRSFFFGGMAPATTPFGTFQFRTGGMRHRTNENNVQGNGNYNLRSLIQILPVLVLILFNFLPSNSPVYMLSRQYPYEHKVVTNKGVPYFVKSSSFEQEYPYDSSNRAYLEQQVERDFFGTLSQHCKIELQRKQWGLATQTPHCDMLRKYEEAEATTA